MSISKQEFQDHLCNEHKTSLFSSYLKEIVYGGNDGIVTTFAVIAGFTGANAGTHQTAQLGVMTVLLFGLANLVADGAAMGLGSFLSLRAEQNIYKAHKEKEWHEINHNPEMEKEETIYLLQEKGYSKEDAEAMCALYMKNKDYWLNFMMTQELEMSNPESENAILTGGATFGSFALFGFLPIIPYLLIQDIQTAFTYSAVFGVLALTLLGTLSGVISGRNHIRTIIETLLVGMTAASLAYFIGTFF